MSEFILYTSGAKLPRYSVVKDSLTVQNDGPGSVSHEDMKQIVHDRYDAFDARRRSEEAEQADGADLREIEELEKQVKQLRPKQQAGE